MSEKMADVAAWRGAHQEIEITEEALLSVAPFPSLHASDFAVFCESKKVHPAVVQFVKDLNKEISWVYSLIAKAQRDANPTKLLIDILDNARQGGGEATPQYALLTQFLRDYAKANNIGINESAAPSWVQAFEEITGPVGTVSSGSIEAATTGPVAPSDEPLGEGVTAPPPDRTTFDIDLTKF